MRTGDFKQTYGELVTLVDSPPVWLWSALLVAGLIVAPFVLNSYVLSFLVIILITVVGALGLNILTGYTGLISLGHVGFLVTGAYAYAVLVSRCIRWSASLARASCRRSPASSSARRRCG
jgi:branched-chain amino acid transport system permease protein